eukprot:PLAT12959.2.p1 GENE.PLAT12959.2~~PLAT12959.2.p1  ORF type:complete len:183 (+),score=59.79 PLAT12959.2:26-574(+)
MGVLLSRVFSSLFGGEEVRVLILGLDGAGKTTILYRLAGETEPVTTVPTIGFNIETLQYKNVKFQVWDLGGQAKIRPYWRCYYTNANAIIFVVDSSDKARLEIAKRELAEMMEEEDLRETILLVFANKQDIDGALEAGELSEALDLPSLRGRSWSIQPCCATTGDGLFEGMDWVVTAIKGAA